MTDMQCVEQILLSEVEMLLQDICRKKAELAVLAFIYQQFFLEEMEGEDEI